MKLIIIPLGQKMDMYIEHAYYLPQYNRCVIISMTVMGSHRFCLTDEMREGEEFYDVNYELNWCMGKNDYQITMFQAVKVMLENDLILPPYSRIKPVEHCEWFLNTVKKLTGVQITEYKPLKFK